jgi:hypothetical protein
VIKIDLFVSNCKTNKNMTTIYSSESPAIRINDCVDKLTMTLCDEYNTPYQPHFEAKGGILTSGTWTLPKTDDIAALINNLVGLDIRTKYITTLPGLNFPTQSLPTQVAQMHSLSQQLAAAQATTFQKPEAKPPAKCVAKSLNPEWFIYDYSPPSFALFVGKELYEICSNKFGKDKEGGGLWSQRLYPDGGTVYRGGWIFSKATANYDLINEMFSVDLKSLLDMSQVKQNGGWKSKQQYQPAKVVSGPFTQQVLSQLPLPKTALPTSGLSMIPSTFENDHHFYTKLSFLCDEIPAFFGSHTEDGKVYYWGPSIQVDEHTSTSGRNTMFEFKCGDNKVVCLI